MSARRLFFFLTLAVSMLWVANATARQVHPYHYSGNSILSVGTDVAIDEANGFILTANKGGTSAKVQKYALNGASAPFEGLEGASSLTLPTDPNELNVSIIGMPIAVDNSGMASQGDFYLAFRDHTKLFGYSKEGLPLPGFPVVLPNSPCDLAVGPSGGVWVSMREGALYREYTSQGQPSGRAIVLGRGNGGCDVELDSAENLYLASGSRIGKFSSNGDFLETVAPGVPLEFGNARTPQLAVDRSKDEVFALFGNGDPRITQYDSAGNPITVFGEPDPSHSFPGLQGATDLAVDSTSGDVYAKVNGKIDVFSPDLASATIPTVTSSPPDQLTGATADLNGLVDPDGITTTTCRFEWGKTAEYDNTVPCAEGNSLLESGGEQEVSAHITGLQKGQSYHYRLVSQNANGILGLGRDILFNAAEPPLLAGASAQKITTDSARIDFQVNPNGGVTTYRVEVGTDPSYGMNFPVPDAAPESLANDKSILVTQTLSQEISGLSPDTTYHYRVFAANPAGETTSLDRTFKTFPTPGAGVDSCPNAQARQQTGAVQLLDCRAYELVSATDTGGYDVRSDQDGQEPLPAYPGAEGRVLYSMRSGTIPGVGGDPTNRGADPYLATRGPGGWSTAYVGLSSTNPFAAGPFASPLLGADENLSTFAFGGEDICSPCFADGSTNVPLRQSNGSIVEGMAGSLDPGPAAAAGTVREPFSADGSHFLFGSTSQFEPIANSDGTDATIYSRNLSAGTTEVVSTDASGTTIQNGAGVAALAVSADGSRTVIGDPVSTDAAGNHYYHLYMHQAGRTASLDLMPGATQGAIFAGMSKAGDVVYFTTKEALSTATDQDADSSADLYRVDVAGATASLSRVSVGQGGAGNSDACDPAPTSSGPHWNAPGLTAQADCSVATVAGGGGVASEAGSIFLLSPERLDGVSGQANEPNLYLAVPGQPPRFVATLESKSTGADPLPTRHPFIKSFGAFNLPQSMAVDQSAGYVYVLDVTAGSIKRFDTEGNPADFSEGPNAGTNALTGFTFSAGSSTGQVAVDDSGGPTEGDVYVTNNSTPSPVVKVYSRAGSLLGQLTGSSTPEGHFGGETGALRYPTGVAVSSFGTVYVAGGSSGKVYRFQPSGNPVVDSDYEATLNFSSGETVPGPLSADSSGTLYANTLSSTGQLASGVGLRRYTAGQFGAAGTQSGATVDATATASSVDPVSDYLYVTRSTSAAEYTPAGELHDVFGIGQLSSAKGIAVLGSPAAANSRVFVSSASGSKKVSIFDTLPAASPLVDNPLVLHAVNASDSRHGEDLQVSPNGQYAVLASTLALSGKDSERKTEIFRYAIGPGTLDCVSCLSTGAAPGGNTTLTPYGLNLADDGRVFFTSPDPLALGDSNERLDAYEWSAGTQQLISSGTDSHDSTLLSVSADSADVFFFTRQMLAANDENGARVRLYTARENGGFAQGPPTTECAASDECHGPASQAAVPTGIGTLAGRPGQFEEEATPGRCARGKVRRRGRCVRRRGHHRSHQRGKATGTRKGGRK